MPVKVLQRDANELKLRIIGESHTSLQLIRSRLDAHGSVEYVNYFPGHLDLDEPEFYIRTSGKKKPEKILQEIISQITSEFESASL